MAREARWAVSSGMQIANQIKKEKCKMLKFKYNSVIHTQEAADTSGFATVVF